VPTNILETQPATQPKNIFEAAPRNIFDTDQSAYARPYAESEEMAFTAYSEEESAALKAKGKIGWQEMAMRQETGDLLPFSPTEYIRLGGVLAAMNRLQDNKYENEQDRIRDERTFTEYARKVEEESIREISWGGKVYQGLSMMPAFAIEIGLSGGIASIAKKGATTVAKKGIKGAAGAVAARLAKEGIVKTAKKEFAEGALLSGIKGMTKKQIAKELVVGSAKRAPVLYNHYTAGYAERQIFANLAITDKGVSVLKEGTETPFVSMAKAGADIYIEVFSESLGAAVLGPLMSKGGKGITSKLTPEVRAGIIKFMNKITSNGTVTRAMTKVGFNGIIEEMGEEVIGDQMRAAFGVEDFGAEQPEYIFDRMAAAVPGWEDLSVMAAMFSVPGVASYTGDRLMSKLRKRGASEDQIQGVMQNMSATEREALLDDFLSEESEWLRAGVKKALAGQELTDQERFGINEKFYELVDAGKIGMMVSEDVQPVADVEKVKAIQAAAAVSKAVAYYQEQHENFKSNIRVVALTEMPEEVPADKAISIFKKSGLTKEEIDYTGINDFLKTKTKFTRKEIVDYIDAHKVKVEIVTKSEKADGSPIDFNTNSQYLTPAVEELFKRIPKGRNRDHWRMELINDSDAYHELMDTFPELKEMEEKGEAWEEVVLDDLVTFAPDAPTKYGGGNLVLPGGEDYMEILITLPYKVSAVDEVARLKAAGWKFEQKEGGEVDLIDPQGRNLGRWGSEESAARSQSRRITPRDQLGGEPHIAMVDDFIEEDQEEYRNRGVVRILKYPSGEMIEELEGGTYVAFSGGERYENPVLHDVEQWLAYELGEEAGEVIDRRRDQPDVYSHPHWEEKNVLAHMRLNFRTDTEGNKVLFLEEVQSDWHKEGRKRGYRKDDVGDPPYNKERYAKLQSDALAALERNDNLGFNSPAAATAAILEADDWANRWEFNNQLDQNVVSAWRAAHIANKKYQSEQGSKIPDAPFKKSWQELVIKKAIETAIQNGATKVAWISGEQSAERYNLWTYYDHVDYRKEKDGSWYMNAVTKDGNNTEKYNLTEQELIDHVGQDNFDRMKKKEGEVRFKESQERGKGAGVFNKKYEVYELTTGRWGMRREGEIVRGQVYENKEAATRRAKELTESNWYIRFADGSELGTYGSKEDATNEMGRINEDLDNPVMKLDAEGYRTGGEKHLAFYDKMLPSIVNKYIAKWGSKVETIDLGTEKRVGEELTLEEEGTTLRIKTEPTKQMGFEITPLMRIEVEEIGQPLFGSKLAAGVTGEALETPSLVEDAIEGKTESGKKKAAKQTRAAKYLQMAARISEIMQSKADLKEKKDQLKETFDYFDEERKQYRNKIKRYKVIEGKEMLREEYNELPKYFRGKEGQTLDDAATEAGFEGDMEFRDYLIRLEQDYQSAKEALADVNEEIRQINERTVIKTEIQNLKQRVTDFEQGKKQGTADLKSLRNDVTRTARKLLPASGKKYIRAILSAIDSIKNEGDVGPAVARIVDNYEKYIDRLIRAKAAKAILKKYKRPENILDVKYQVKIQEVLSGLGVGRKEQRKALTEMSTEELVGLAREVMGYIETGKLTLAKKAEMKIMASEIARAAAIKAAGGTVDILASGSQEEFEAKKGINKFDLEFIRPLRLIRELFGDYGVKMFYDSVHDAETFAQAEKILRIQKLESVMNKYGMNMVDLGDTVSIDGMTFQINDILTMYAQRNNAEARPALIHGNGITEETFDKFIAWLEANRPKYTKGVEEIKKIIGEKKQTIADTMADSWNIVMKFVEDYFPMHRQLSDSDEEALDPLMATELIGDAVVAKGHGVNYTAVNKAFTITREQIAERNQKPIKLDFIGTALRAIDTQEHFIAFSGIQKMYNNIKGDEAVRNSVIYNKGQAAWNTFDEYMNEVINPRVNMRSLGFIEQRLRETRKALGTFYLGFNIVTALKQYPSAHLALKYTTLGQLYKSMGKSLVSLKELEEKIFPMDPSLKNRIVERDIGEIMQRVGKMRSKDWIVKGKVILTAAQIRELQVMEQRVGKAAFAMILNMDKRAVLAVYDAVYEHQRKTVSEKEARDIASKAVLETQPQGRRVDLPKAHRTNNEFYRFSLMFTNQLNQIYNMYRWDMPREWAAGDRKKAMVGLASIMASSLMIYIASHGGAWPDDDEEMAAAVFDAIGGSFLSAVPIAGNLIMSGIRGYAPSISPLDSMVQSAKYTVNKFKNDEEFEGMLDTVVQIGALTGRKIPFTQLNRTRKGLLDLLSGESTDIRRLIWSKSALFE
jgi:hypothetical protein